MKDKIKLTKTDIPIPEKKEILFKINDKDILKLETNGDIFVKGNLIKNDKEVYPALVEFLNYVIPKPNYFHKDKIKESLMKVFNIDYLLEYPHLTEKMLELTNELKLE